jgi:hypothetical protein
LNYTLGGTHLSVPAGVAVTIATLGRGPRAVIDGERQSRLFFVSGGDLRAAHQYRARARGTLIDQQQCQWRRHLREQRRERARVGKRDY